MRKRVKTRLFFRYFFRGLVTNPMKERFTAGGIVAFLIQMFIIMSVLSFFGLIFNGDI